MASIPGNYPGFALADKVVYENTVDKKAMLALAKAEQVAGVCVCGTDVCVPAQGYVCDQLGLKGPSEAAAERAQDKALMKAAFEKGGVRTARFIHVDMDNANPVDLSGDRLSGHLQECGLLWQSGYHPSQWTRGHRLRL